jgi:hypothetical protein
MSDLKHSYLAPSDPNNTDGPFSLMRDNISGREQWWRGQVWVDDSTDKTVMVWFLELGGPTSDLVDLAHNLAGCPWYLMPWISDKIPTRFSPSFRLSLDMPGGKQITHEWGPDPIGNIASIGRKTIKRMLEMVCGGLVDG